MNFYEIKIRSKKTEPLITKVLSFLAQNNLSLYDSQLASLQENELQWVITIAIDNSNKSQEKNLLSKLAAYCSTNGYLVGKVEELPSVVFNNSLVITIVHKQLLLEDTVKQVISLIPTNGRLKQKSLGNRAYEIVFSLEENKLADCKKSLSLLAEKHKVDIFLQKQSMERRDIRLASFDMDSTLIQQEVIDELAKEAGCGQAITQITEQAMQGQINFNKSLSKRLQQLAGLSEDTLEKAHKRIHITLGAKRLLQTLNAINCKTTIISGGFTWFAKQLQAKLGIDNVVANHLEINNGKLTGRVLGNIVDPTFKKESLIKLMQTYHIEKKHTIAVGDGANDIPMLEAAGRGVAFYAKPATKKKFSLAIDFNGLDSLLYLLGWHDDEIHHLIETAKQ